MNILEEKIIAAAEELFLEKGIDNVEMTEIAKKANVNRTSIYRHFNSKIEIAFPIVQKYLTELFVIPEKEDVSASGYEKLYRYTMEIAQRLCSQVNKVRFIRAFDGMYDMPETLSDNVYAHEQWLRNFSYAGYRYYAEGIMDGSIKDDGLGNLTITCIMNTCLGVATKVLPREEAYIYEFDIGRAILFHALKLQLDAIKAPQSK